MDGEFTQVDELAANSRAHERPSDCDYWIRKMRGIADDPKRETAERARATAAIGKLEAAKRGPLGFLGSSART